MCTNSLNKDNTNLSLKSTVKINKIACIENTSCDCGVMNDVWLNLKMTHLNNFSLYLCHVLDAAAAYAYRDHAQLQLIGKHFEGN